MSAENIDPEDSASLDEVAFVTIACDAAHAERAAELVRHAVNAGECVVLPTDTVYGVAADAFSADGVRRLLQAKGRGRDMPPPVLISDAAVLEALASAIPPDAHRLVEAFWPGALTLILVAQPSLRMDLGDTEGSIAVRVPADGRTRAILATTGPLAVSSANRSGSSPARNVEEAIAQLGDSVSVYVDGGPSGPGTASTIVDFTGGQPAIVRQGSISVEAIAQIIPGVQIVGDPSTPPRQPPSPAASTNDA